MFEVICVRKQRTLDADEPVDLGLLVEAMLFYRQVRLIADRGILQQLARDAGPEVFLELIEQGYLSVTYLENMLGIKTENTNTPNELHQPVTLAVVGHSSLQDAAPEVFQQVTGKQGKGRRLASRFIRLAHPINYNDEVRSAAIEDYMNTEYVQQAAAQLLAEWAPEYVQPVPLEFAIQKEGTYLKVTTNIDFAQANESHHRHFPPEVNSLRPAWFLINLMEVCGDLHLSSLYSGEIATSPTTSALIQLKCRNLISSRVRNAEAIQLFQHQVLNGHAVREAVNAKEKDFKDVVALLKSADKFRDWLRNQEPSVDLIKSYYEAVTKSTWAGKLPVKILRWAVLTGAGLSLEHLVGPLGVGAAAGLAAADSLLLERIAAGWRPNQFVENRLIPFSSAARTP
jgi:hypothetical protein